MAESAHIPALAELATAAGQNPNVLDSPRHSGLVRITHWIATFSFLALVVSGIAILLAHPRLYWGETGALGTPSLVDLPLPLILTGQTGWGRYLHFLAAWVFVLTGIIYVLAGLAAQHFRKTFLPSKADLAWDNVRRVVINHLRLQRHLTQPGEAEFYSYNVLQRLTYLGVVFVLSPLIILTGLAMSPAITSVFPTLVTVFGGQQSARTLHFFVASLLVIFLVVHVAMVSLAGFTNRMRAMITGHGAAGKELS